MVWMKWLPADAEAVPVAAGDEHRELVVGLCALNLDPAVAAREAAIGLLAASGCRKSACHPECDLRRSWKSLAANAGQGGTAA
jgi:hypothetical protein